MTALEGSRVLIVGASGVLGSYLAKECSRRGATVVGVANAGGVNEYVSSSVVADITKAADRAEIVDAVRTLGGINTVVFASGVVGFGPHNGVSTHDIDRIIEIDLVAPLQLMSDLSPLVADGGNITFITGAVVDVATLGTSAYTAAKAGLSAAAAIIRRELRSRGITVIDARPPHTETGLATRAIFGSAPVLKQGLDPEVVARRIVDAIENQENELPPAAFSQL